MPDKVITSSTPCDCCGAPPSGDCICGLIVGDGGYGRPDVTPFASLAGAIAAIQTFDHDTSPSIVRGCFALFPRSGEWPDASASIGANSFTITYIADVPVGIVSFTAKAGDTISVPGGMDFGWVITDCLGTGLIGGPGNDSWVVPADGEYVFLGSFSLPSKAAWTVSSSGTLLVNPIVALWNDSGTVRRLEACPKFRLPFLTEASGDWYLSEGDAEADIAAQVSGCVGYTSLPPDIWDSFTASDAGSGVTFTMSAGLGILGVDFVCSLFIPAGVSVSMSTDMPLLIFDIYDSAGNLVENGTGTLSSPVPASDRYIIKIYCASVAPPPPTSVVGSVSASGATVCQVQALYDAGLPCPGRVNCA